MKWAENNTLKNTPYDRDWKRQDFFDCKTYSLATLHLRIANYKALLAKYDHSNYSKLSEFIEFIPEEKREQCRTIISEGHLLARTALQAALHSADITV